MSRLRAGVVGLGVGEQHIAGFEMHPDCKVVAVADPDPAKLARMAEHYPHLERHADPEELLRRPDIDVVAIASPDDKHYDQILLAIDQGKNLFIEKPVCMTSDELADLHARLDRRSDLHLSSNLILRRSPRFLDLKRRIDTGEMGRMYYLEADYNYGRIHKILSGWRGAIPNYSITLGGGVHVIDLMIWLTGRRVVEVTAFGNGICTEGTGFDRSDLIAALLRFDDGTVAKATSNFGCVHPHFHRLVAYGTEATFENRLPNAQLWTSRDPATPPAEIATDYPGVAKGALIPSFVDQILGRGVAHVTAADVFDTMSVCFAIDEANRTAATMRVEYPNGKR